MPLSPNAPKPARITAKDLSALGFTKAQILKMPQTIRNFIGNSIITGVGAPEPPGAINPHPQLITVGGGKRWLWLSNPSAKAVSSSGVTGGIGNPYKATNNWFVDILTGLVGGEAAALALGVTGGGAAAEGGFGAAATSGADAAGTAADTAGAGAGGTAGGTAGGAAGAAGKVFSAGNAIKGALTGAAALSILLDPMLWRGLALTIAGAILILLAVRGTMQR